MSAVVWTIMFMIGLFIIVAVSKFPPFNRGGSR